MCILIKQPLGHVFSEAELADFYSFNPDGVGVMWAENGTINICKVVPNNIQDVKDFYSQHVAGKACTLHFRWTTHGDTDLLNCHPYEVFGEADGYPIYLMHNGQLATGNAEDKSKSDTYLYIQNIIRPALKADPTQFMAEWFKTLIEDHIGFGNKFVMMDAYGNTVTFNESSGITIGEVFYSNTYAWTAPKPNYVAPKYPASHGNSWANNGYMPRSTWEHEDDYSGYTLANPAVPPVPVVDKETQEAWEYAHRMQSLFQDLSWFIAYASIAAHEIKEYYLNVGDYAAMLIEYDIEDGNYTEKDVIEMFSSSHEPEDFIEKDARLAVGML